MSSIYYIRCTLTGLVKIGLSGNPMSRLSKIQSDSPGVLELLGVEPGNLAREQEVHARFAAHRVRGEWFSPAPELMAHVETLEALEPKRKAKTAAESPTVLGRSIGITKGHASSIMNGSRTPSDRLAVRIFRASGAKFGRIANLSDAEIDGVEKMHA